MKTKSAVSIACLLALAGLAVGCGEAGEEASADPDAPVVIEVDSDLLSRGQLLYTQNCTPCHGPLGKGDGPASATLNPKPRDHTRQEYMDTLTDQRIADTIRMGGAAFGYPNMPSSPHIRGDDLAAVIAYLRTLSRGQGNVSAVELNPGF